RLRVELLRIVLAERALPQRIRLADRLGRLRLRHGHELHVVRVSPAGRRGARDAIAHFRQPLRDAHRFPRRGRAYHTITSLVRSRGPPWKSPSTLSISNPL